MRVTILALFATLAATASYADTILPAADVNIRLDPASSYTSYGGTSAPFSDSYSLSNLGGTLTGTYQLGSDPQVSTSISFSGPVSTPETFETVAQVSYYFAVNGPANQTVSVTIDSTGQAAVSTAVTGGLYGTASLSIGQYGDSAFLTESADAEAPASLSGSYSIDQAISVLTNTVYFVDLDTTAGVVASSSRPGPYSASASIDPTITLDTTDPAYSLAFSPNLTSPAPTPEPSSLLLLATGLASSAGLIRRRVYRA